VKNNYLNVIAREVLGGIPSWRHPRVCNVWAQYLSNTSSGSSAKGGKVYNGEEGAGASRRAESMAHGRTVLEWAALERVAQLDRARKVRINNV
jgi:hypothetical protein